MENSILEGGIATNDSGLIYAEDTAILLSNATVSGGIHNNGTILGDDIAILINEGTELRDGITNYTDAIIDGGSTGIQINSSSVSADINNLGSIIGNEDDGINIDNSTIDSITNSASASILGDNGIRIDSSTVSGAISNSGSITGNGSAAINITDSSINSITNFASASMLGDLVGIKIQTSTLSGAISNSGNIIATQYEAIYIENGVLHSIDNESGAVISGGLYGIILNSSSISSGITNNGSIIGNEFDGISLDESTVTGGITNESAGLISGVSKGINIDNSSISGGISNSGTVIGNEAGIYINDNGIVNGGITNSGGFISGGIINSGSILSGENSIAISATSAGTITGGITNEFGGLISGTDSGIKIDGPGLIGDITNSGTILGDIYAIHISNLDDNQINIIISGDDAHVIGDVYDEDYENGDSFATISGNFTTQGNWTVSDLEIASGKILTISEDDTVTLNTMAEGTGGTIKFSILDAENHATLNVTGGNINLTGTNLNIYALNTDNLSNGEKIKIGTGTSSVTGITGLQSVTDNAFLWDFSIGDGSNVDGGTSDELYLFANEVVFESANSGVANTIFNLSDNDSPVVQQTLENLLNASAPERELILESLNPTADGTSFVASQNISGSITTLTDTRLASLRDGNPSSGIATGDGANNKNIWAQAFGKTAKQGIRGGISGYDANTNGVALGVDRSVNNDIANIGIAIGMSKTAVSSNNLNTTSTNVDSYQVSFYSDYMINERTFVEGNIGYVYGSSTSVKHNVGGAEAYSEGQYDSQQLSARAKLGRHYKLGENKIILSTLANYSVYSEDSYTETGNAGPLLLSVNNENVQQFEMGIGAELNRDFDIGNYYILRPSASVGYRHDFLDDSFVSNASFTGGGSFTTNGLNPANDTLDLGAGLKLLNSDSWNVSVDYGYEYKKNHISHTGMLKLGSKF